MADTTRNPTQRIPPHNTDAERSLLGAMLLNPNAVIEGIEGCATDRFHSPAHSHIYNAICRVYARNEPVDLITVAEELRRDNLLDDIGGTAALIDIQGGTISTANAARYARIITEHHTLRELARVAADITDLAYSLPDDTDNAVDQAESLLYTVANHTRTSRATHVADHLHTWLDELETRMANGTLSGVPTGWVDLDNILLGLHPGQLITVAARPSIGKSAWAGNLAYQIATTGRPVLFCSLEMSADELLGRFVASTALIDIQHLRKAHLVEKDWERLNNHLGTLTEAPIHILDDPCATLLTIRAEARRVTRTGPLAAVIVDYLQLLNTTGRAENRQVEVAELSRGLKRIALELRVPVVALAQLNRNLEYRGDKRPVLADLRESGAIENDSDVVMFLYRDDVYHPDSTDRGVAEIIVAKQRNGPTGTVRLAFLNQYGRFANMAKGI